MIKIEEILHKQRSVLDPNVGQDKPDETSRALIDLEEAEHKRMGDLWLYMPMFDSVLIFKIYATRGFQIVWNMGQYVPITEMRQIAGQLVKFFT